MIGDAPYARTARQVRQATSEAITLRRQGRYDKALAAARRAHDATADLYALIRAEQAATERTTEPGG